MFNIRRYGKSLNWQLNWRYFQNEPFSFIRFISLAIRESIIKDLVCQFFYAVNFLKIFWYEIELNCWDTRQDKRIMPLISSQNFYARNIFPLSSMYLLWYENSLCSEIHLNNFAFTKFLFWTCYGSCNLKRFTSCFT